jgi:DNA repair protein RecO (recombination protein O)
VSPTYKATGINLKSMPLGEADRLLTILTREQGLIRAVAPGSRKHHSKIGGRSALFVVNDLLISKGRTLDKITQAETIESFPRLSQDLGKLTAGQYLVELTLLQALTEQPQAELFELLNDALKHLAHADPATVLAYLTYAIFQLLTLAGIAPQTKLCCLSQRPLYPNFAAPDWQTGFSSELGGVVLLSELESNPTLKNRPTKLSAVELALLQQLAQPDWLVSAALIPGFSTILDTASSLQAAWLNVEQVLRNYAQYYFDRPIRSAALIETCFVSSS